jgi:hypothetical protein
LLGRIIHRDSVVGAIGGRTAERLLRRRVASETLEATMIRRPVRLLAVCLAAPVIAWAWTVAVIVFLGASFPAVLDVGIRDEPLFWLVFVIAAAASGFAAGREEGLHGIRALVPALTAVAGGSAVFGAFLGGGFGPEDAFGFLLLSMWAVVAAAAYGGVVLATHVHPSDHAALHR